VAVRVTDEIIFSITTTTTIWDAERQEARVGESLHANDHQGLTVL